MQTDTPKNEYNVIEKVQMDAASESNNEDLIKMPWDDDNFSLCLDTFPSSRLANTKYNKYPTIASPLRRHWGSYSEEELVDDDDEKIIMQDVALPGVEEEQNEIWIHDCSVTSSTATITKSKNTTRKKSKKNMENAFNIVIGSSFPYNNNTNFIPYHEEKKKSPSIITQKSRVEHISPLSNSSIILGQDDILNQPLSPQSSRSLVSMLSRKQSDTFSVQSNISSMVSLSSHHHNGSQISRTTTEEAWKLAQNLPLTRSLSNAISPRLSPHQQQQQNRQHNSPLSNQHNFYRSGSNSSIRANSSTPSRPIVPTLNSNLSSVSNLHHGPNYSLHAQNSCSSSASGYYYTPAASLAGNVSTAQQSYRSIVVSKNADKLVFYSDEPSLHPPSIISEKSTTFSEYFKPEYKPKKKKSSHAKSSGLLTKLMKNLKHHFIKSQ
jgi:hypothetical protein